MAPPVSKITVDPAFPGTSLKRLFLLEGTLNLCGAVPMLFYPGTALSYLSSSLTPNPTAENLIQLLGALTVGITPQLFLALPDSKQAIESRRTVYITLGAGEVMMVPLLLWMAWKGENGGMGLSPKSCLMAALNLATPLAWRAYVLYIRPEMLGRYRESKVE